MASGMSDPQDQADRRAQNDPITTDRPFSAADVAYINRMTTTGHVLPSVAHDINNSLQVIAGMVEILALRGQLAPEVTDKLEKIAAQAGRAAGNLRELVAFARRDGASARIDLRTAVERAVTFRRYYLAKGRVTVTVEPRGSGPFVAQVDSQQVVQVLVNLILNAEEALAPIEPREIRVGIWREADQVHCEVADSGHGFTDDARARAGTAFFTTKSGGAAGLGLAMTRQMVEAARGRLVVGAGGASRVVISLPAAPA
jgi:signal transduction histidine kinase